MIYFLLLLFRTLLSLRSRIQRKRRDQPGKSFRSLGLVYHARERFSNRGEMGERGNGSCEEGRRRAPGASLFRNVTSPSKLFIDLTRFALPTPSGPRGSSVLRQISRPVQISRVRAQLGIARSGAGETLQYSKTQVTHYAKRTVTFLRVSSPRE